MIREWWKRFRERQAEANERRFLARGGHGLVTLPYVPPEDAELPDDGLMMIEERKIMTDEKLREVIYQAAGAATGPLLADHPDYVFPSERVLEAIHNCLKGHGLEHLAYPVKE